MSLTRVVAALAIVGAAIAGYLTWVHFAAIEPFCVGGGGACERVQTSPYASLVGVPVAVLGLGGYLAILASLALSDRSVTAFLALVGAGFSLYLTYVELAVIHAVCQWCVASAVVMTALAVTSVARMVRGTTDSASVELAQSPRQSPEETTAFPSDPLRREIQRKEPDVHRHPRTT